MPLMAVLHDMPHDLYRLCLRNAVIAGMEESKEGRQYLQDSIRLRQTEPDLAKIRSKAGYAAEIVSHAT